LSKNIQEFTQTLLQIISKKLKNNNYNLINLNNSKDFNVQISANTLLIEVIINQQSLHNNNNNLRLNLFSKDNKFSNKINSDSIVEDKRTIIKRLQEESEELNQFNHSHLLSNRSFLQLFNINRIIMINIVFQMKGFKGLITITNKSIKA